MRSDAAIASASGSASLTGERQVHALHHREVEQQLHLVALVAEELAQVLGRQVDLTEQQGVALASRHEPAEVLEEVVRVECRVARDRALLEQERHRIDPEAVDAELEPEAHDLRDLLAHPRVRDVEVGLVRVEVVQVPLAGLLVPGPDAVLGVGEDDRRRVLGRALVAPDVEVAERRGSRGSRGPEPRVPVRRVVHDEVDDDPHAAVLRRADRRHEVAERAQPVVDGVVVGDVVAVVPVGRRLERHEPQAADADAGEVVDPLDQSREVAVPVVVPVEEGLDVEAVQHRVLPPEVARARQRHGATSGSTRSPNTSMNRSWSVPTWCR